MPYPTKPTTRSRDLVRWLAFKGLSRTAFAPSHLLPQMFADIWKETQQVRWLVNNGTNSGMGTNAANEVSSRWYRGIWEIGDWILAKYLLT